MISYEGIRLKIRNKIIIPITRRKKAAEIVNSDFTIISNNCWGGTVYESYNLPKKTPTVGLFFMADDYIKFLTNLKKYVKAELIFIDPMKSRWKKDIMSDPRFGTYPVGVLQIGEDILDSIEIFFLHYSCEQEAKEKWERRVQRINWNRLLVKFNDQNGCNENHIERFLHLNYDNKIFFTGKNWEQSRTYAEYLGGGYIYVKQWPKGDFIRASFEPLGKNRYINLESIINNL